jgi:hypothetical protein
MVYEGMQIEEGCKDDGIAFVQWELARFNILP